jgi:hypothetical protein
LFKTSETVEAETPLCRAISLSLTFFCIDSYILDNFSKYLIGLYEHFSIVSGFVNGESDKNALNIRKKRFIDEK